MDDSDRDRMPDSARMPSWELKQFVDGLARRPELWRHLVRHSPDARVYEQIWDDERVNAWLICWSRDQDTGFHDHDSSAAAIAVLGGQIREERLRLAAPPAVRVIGPGGTVAIPAVAIHRVLHAGGGPATTIHAYSPPLERTGAYRIGSGGELERASEDSAHELTAQHATALPAAA